MARGTRDETPRRSGDFPEDRFDSSPSTGRIGAHRVTARPRRFWYYFVAGLLAFAVLTTAGVFVLQNVGAGNRFVSEGNGGNGGGALPERIDPVLDPSATVAVLNGSEIPNLAAGVEQVITDNEWGQIMFSGNAAQTDIQISTVFYSEAADEAAAAGLAQELGGVSAYQNADYAEYGARLVVLLGSDYEGPGLAEAEQIAAPEGDDAGIPLPGGEGEEGLPQETPEEGVPEGEGGAEPVQ